MLSESPSSSITLRFCVRQRDVQVLFCIASYTPLASRTMIPGVDFAASVTLCFVSCHPWIPLQSGRAANNSSSVLQACWISAPRELLATRLKWFVVQAIRVISVRWLSMTCCTEPSSTCSHLWSRHQFCRLEPHQCTQSTQDRFTSGIRKKGG